MPHNYGMWSLIHALIPDTLNNMMTSSNGNIFRVTGHLCGEFTGPRWIPHTKASDAEFWCFLWSTPKVNNREAGDVRRQHGHYDVIVMVSNKSQTLPLKGSCTLITRASYGVPRVWFWRAVTAKCGHAYQKQLLGAGTSNICSLYGGFTILVELPKWVFVISHFLVCKQHASFCGVACVEISINDVNQHVDHHQWCGDTI